MTANKLQVKLPNLNSDQMEQLRQAKQDGRTDEQVRWLASTGLRYDIMKRIRQAWKERKTDAQIKEALLTAILSLNKSPNSNSSR